MKIFVVHSVFFALIGLVLSPLAVAHASSSPADTVHFCAPFDYEQWRRDHPRPAGKRLADLNVGEPRTVRMIYFLPNDRPYRQEVVDSMKVMIRRVQTFYAEQMQAHGYGNRTFRFERDAAGEPLVHRVDGRHSNSNIPSRMREAQSKVYVDIDPIFDFEENVYLIVVDKGDTSIDGLDGGGVGGRSTKNGGTALVSTVLPSHIAVLNHLRANVYCINFGKWKYLFCRMPFTNRSLICSKQVVHSAWVRTKVLPFNQMSSTGFSCGV